jgi:hypothetical protein
MLVLTKGITSNIVVTLTEKQLLTSPNYLFIFTGRTTNTEVKFVLLNAADISQYKQRYNKFNISNTLFSTAKVEQYIYNIYEQTSTSNTNPIGLNLLETGIMDLKQSATIFTSPIGVETEFIIPS